MLAEFVATKGTTGTLEVVPSWDGHRSMGGVYGQQHQKESIDGRGEREEDEEDTK